MRQVLDRYKVTKANVVVAYFVGFGSQYAYTATLCHLVADILKTFSANPASAFAMQQMRRNWRTGKNAG